MNEAIYDEMSGVLNVEREALLEADFDRVFAIGDHKQALLQEVLKHSSQPNALFARIVEQLDRNQKLIHSALSGVSQAQSRIKELQHVHKNLSVYSEDGSLSHVNMEKPEFEKKA